MSPPEWPERPGSAEDFDEFWLVRGLPPDPFPGDYDYGNDRARFGPPGTRWVFTTEQLVNRRTALGVSQAAKAGVERLIKKLAIKLPPVGSMGWVTPLPDAPAADPVGGAMRWIHCTINAKLGASETMTHTLNFRTNPQPDVDQDVAAIQLFANQIRDIWQNAWTTALPNTPSALSGLFGQHVGYVGVTAAYLEQTAPATQTRVGRRIQFGYPRPRYLVPTQYADFAQLLLGTNPGAPLPFEVACVASLKTGQRGARNRGRLYLGGIASNSVSTAGPDSGLFTTPYTDGVQKQVAALVHAMNTGTGARVHIVSRAYATSTGVNGVTVGRVPDSQRRRRRSQLEAYPVATVT